MNIFAALKIAASAMMDIWKHFFRVCRPSVVFFFAAHTLMSFSWGILAGIFVALAWIFFVPCAI